MGKRRWYDYGPGRPLARAQERWEAKQRELGDERYRRPERGNGNGLMRAGNGLMRLGANVILAVVGLVLLGVVLIATVALLAG